MEQYFLAELEKTHSTMTSSERFDFELRWRKALKVNVMKPETGYKYAETYDKFQMCESCHERVTALQRYCGKCFYKCKGCKLIFLRMASAMFFNFEDGAEMIQLEKEQYCAECKEKEGASKLREFIMIVKDGGEGTKKRK